MTIMLSGIQPTSNGIPHLGNFIGAIKNFNNITASTKIFMIADQHATTLSYDPLELKNSCLKNYAILKACGVEGCIYRQSSLKEHSMLSQIFTHLMTLGPLERMTQFKDKSSKEEIIPLGLLTYPILMAADILLFKTDIVPVGEDQHQHLQLTRDILKRFNNFVKSDYFTEPKTVTMLSSKIMSLDNPEKKMSKSGNHKGVIFLDEDMDIVSKKYKKAVSETQLIDENYKNRKPLLNLLTIMSCLLNEDIKNIAEKYYGKGFGILKKDIIEIHEMIINPITKQYNYYMKNQNALEKEMKENTLIVKEMARKNIKEIYTLCGLSYMDFSQEIELIINNDDLSKQDIINYFLKII